MLLGLASVTEITPLPVVLTCVACFVISVGLPPPGPIPGRSSLELNNSSDCGCAGGHV